MKASNRQISGSIMMIKGSRPTTIMVTMTGIITVMILMMVAIEPV